MIGFGDSEALYACYAMHPQPAYLDHPGLIGVIMQIITIFLTALAIVGERERGTLDQLLVTPIGSTGLMLGKIVPYAVIGFVDFLGVFAATVG